MSAPRCPECGRLRLVDAFAGEGGAGKGYQRAGFCTDAVDRVPNRKTRQGRWARLEYYPTDCPKQRLYCTDAIEYLYEQGHKYAAAHASPTCTGYTRGTAAIPDRLDKYDRLIPVVREVLAGLGIVYVIENVEDAAPELRSPVMLCGRQFGLAATDTDGTPLVMDRHRLFESNVLLMVPPHEKHDLRLQVAGSYSGGRRDKREAREIRKGGYVPKSVDVQRALLGTPWMTEKGCQLSIPPAYTEHIGAQLIDHLAAAGAA